MQKFIQQLINTLETGENVCLVSIVAESGSTPRGVGAHMAVCEHGSCFGTIGGGAVEHEAQKVARNCLESRESTLQNYSLKPGDAASLGMVCGGAVKVELRFLDAKNSLDLTEMRNWLELEQKSQPRVWIFGAGHVGSEVAPVLEHIGFYTIVLDDREEFLAEDRLPLAKERLLVDLAKPTDGLVIGSNDYIIIVTRGHQHDYEVLRASLRTDAKYIGMIGSRSKNATVFSKLRKDGFSEEDISRVTAPIGISLGADTPEEIAISIAAQLIRVRADYVE